MIAIEKYVYQRNIKDCGVACLLSIIRHYNGNNTYENIRYLTKCDNNGIRALNLIEASKKLGFNAKGIKCNIEDINKIKLPNIAHCTINKNYNHYVVIKSIKNDTIFIFDPYKGNIKYKTNDFKLIWNNIIIELIPYRILDNIKENNNRLYLNIVKKYIKSYISIIILSFISITLTIISNYYFKSLIDNNIKNILIIFTAILLTKEIFDNIRNQLIIKLENNIDKYIMVNTHNKILTLPNYYFNTRSNGDIMSKINDLNYLKELLIKIPIFFSIDLILLILSSIIMIKINIILFLIILITVFLYFVVMFIFNKKNKELISINQENNAINNSILLENIKTINTIKNLNIIEHKQKTYENNYDYMIIKKKEYEHVYNTENTIKNIILYSGINIVLYYGIKTITLSNLILFNSMMLYFIEPLKSLYEINPLIKNGVNALKRISEIYDIKTNKKGIVTSKYNIEIKNLSYSYNGYNNVIKNINLNINENEKVVVLGKSGIGKSTLFKLINKNYEVDNNTIFIGDKDINIIDEKEILSYVSQDESLFKDTITNNILLNKNMDIKKTLYITNVYKIINKYNYILEEDGNNLSRGEKQKIILARTLVQDRKILILDEALNALDEDEEYEIVKRLVNIYKDKTIIYITHRTNCLELFNRQINFNDMI